MGYLQLLALPWGRAYVGIHMGGACPDSGSQDLVSGTQNAQYSIFDHRNLFPGAWSWAVLYIVLSDYGGFGTVYGKRDRDSENRRGDCAGDDIWACASPELV